MAIKKDEKKKVQRASKRASKIAKKAGTSIIRTGNQKTKKTKPVGYTVTSGTKKTKAVKKRPKFKK